MNTILTAAELLEQLNKQIDSGNVKDSVHKIKLMTARDVIKEIIKA